MAALLLIACQAGAASQVDDAEGEELAATAGQAQSVAVAYQLQQEFPISISVTSTSIKHTGYLLKDFTCEGGNLSPQLTWTGVPAEAQSLAIVVDDIDAEEGALAHWLLWSLPADTTDLEGGVSGSESLPAGAVEGTNGYGGAGWKGPCPPPRRIYRHVTTHENTGIVSNVYRINVYALDTEIPAAPGASREDVLRQIDGHVVAGGLVETRYLSSIVIRE